VPGIIGAIHEGKKKSKKTMNIFLYYLIAALQLTLLNLVMSADNVGAIALSIRDLPAQQAKSANLLGLSGAVVLKIVFCIIITAIMMIKWLPIELLGGLLLLKITWDMVKTEDEDPSKEVKSSDQFWKSVLNIVLADLSMSLDNVLGITGIAKGNIWLVAFGLFMSMPILFFGSNFVTKLMNQYKIIVYIGAAILAHTAICMILSDGLVAPHVNGVLAALLPWLVLLAVTGYGFFQDKNLISGCKRTMYHFTRFVYKLFNAS
jgi:YjbE family integral membrane protein